MEGGQIPETWAGTEIVPIFKKGYRDNPANYRPISLIDNIKKMFCHQVLSVLQTWILDNDILSNFQAGFRPCISTVDQVFRFNMIRWKTVDLGGGSLYLAFVDLMAAFDLVWRPKLWEVLRQLAIPEKLLNVIIQLHWNNYASIRWGPRGETTNRVGVVWGVQQGCVVAPTLFLLFINSCVEFLLDCRNDSPSLGGFKTPALLFADNTLLVSKTMTGLKILLDKFNQYCKNNSLELNPSKTKFMVVSPRKKG